MWSTRKKSLLEKNGNRLLSIRPRYGLKSTVWFTGRYFGNSFCNRYELWESFFARINNLKHNKIIFSWYNIRKSAWFLSFFTWTGIETWHFCRFWYNFNCHFFDHEKEFQKILLKSIGNLGTRLDRNFYSCKTSRFVYFVALRCGLLIRK